MKSCLIFFLTIFLCYSIALCENIEKLSQEVESGNISKIESLDRIIEYAKLVKYKFPIYINIEDMVHILRESSKVPINFESEVLQRDKNTVRAKILYEQLSGFPKEYISTFDKERLNDLKKLISSKERERIVGYTKRYIQIDYNDLKSFENLKKAIKTSAIFTAESDGESMTIYPKNSFYKAVNLTVYAKSTAELIHEILPILSERKLSMCVFLARSMKIMNNGKLDTSFLPSDNTATQHIELKVTNADFRKVITSLCNQASPKIQWTISGYGAGRNISFYFKENID